MMFSITAPFKKQKKQNNVSSKKQVNYVGCMRNSRKPKDFFKLLSQACAHYDLTLVYFSPKDVDMDRGTANGKVLVNDVWEEREVEIPRFIDVSNFCYKHRSVMNYLGQVSTLSSERIGSKAKLYKAIKESGEFDHLIIPYITTDSPKDVFEFLFQHQEVILKPKIGKKGEHIYKISFIDTNQFMISYETTERIFNREELINFLANLVTNKKYICQRYIHSYDNNQNPFDCRIRLEKNLNGNWEIAINLVRISSSQKVVSNVAQGGYVSELEAFLKVNYPDNWETIQKEINQVGEELPLHIEEVTGKTLNSLGIDIGIDQDGKPFLFEANTAPGVDYALGEIAMLKSGYYYYMLKNVLRDDMKAI
ncbi:YheC/YheD family protein [Alkalibacillus haloalkaliphilus]|uniref:YheC/YheD family protein n=1 Tax=Alkalibacillus haloalkaliphilus TaxID=94136 RepID=UPI0002F8BCC0|nr:YheC/YheD family protein [Alkalibacillus haloalkaliphilus]